MRYSRTMRYVLGSLLLVALIGALLLPLQDPEVVESLRRTGVVLERELPGYQPFELHVEVPSVEYMEVGNLLTVSGGDGREEVIGELVRIEPHHYGGRLTFRILPEGEEELYQESLVEVIYPPRSFNEHLHLLFPEPFQDELKRRLYLRSADLLGRLKPHAYEKISALEPHLEGWFVQVRDKTLPTEDEVKAFVASDLYPKLRREFDGPLQTLIDLLIANFDAEFDTWGQTKLVWNVLMGDSDALKEKLSPVVSETLEQFFRENQDDLLNRLKGVWSGYEPELLKHLEETAAPEALRIFEEEAGKVIVEEVILPLLDEQQAILLDAAKEEVIWSYRETVFNPDALFHERFVYVARNQAFKKQEVKFDVRPVAQGGTPLDAGGELAAWAYFAPETSALNRMCTLTTAGRTAVE